MFMIKNKVSRNIPDWLCNKCGQEYPGRCLAVMPYRGGEPVRGVSLCLTTLDEKSLVKGRN